MAAQGLENTIKVKVTHVKFGPDIADDQHIHFLSCILFFRVSRSKIAVLSGSVRQVVLNSGIHQVSNGCVQNGSVERGNT